MLQLVQAGSEVYVYQYVSYPAKVAAQMSKEKAIVYVNEILRLIAAAQRGH